MTDFFPFFSAYWCIILTFSSVFLILWLLHTIVFTFLVFHFTDKVLNGNLTDFHFHFFFSLMHHSHVPAHKTVLNIISTLHVPEISVFASKISSVIQSVSDSQSGFDCTVIAGHFGFFDYIVVDSGLLFAVFLCKTNIHNIASKDLKSKWWNNNDFRFFTKNSSNESMFFDSTYDFRINSCSVLKKCQV